jgi:sodium-dependent dicarboxylate transporter 2/3/5
VSRDDVRRYVLYALTAAGTLIALLAKAGWLTPPEGLSPEGLIVAGVMIVMAANWILEGMPLAATAMIPLVALPLLGVMPGKQLAKAYMSSTIFLLMGGFFLAKGLERWGIPARVAAIVEKAARGSPRALIAGLMGTTALMSMWLSNTATTLIMATVALSAVQRAGRSDANKPQDVRRFEVATMLGIAYAANVGGLATPVGTAPNAILLGLYGKLAPEAPAISFLDWMIATLPVVVLLVPGIYFLLTRVLQPFPKDLDLGGEQQQQSPGPMPRGAKLALAIFVFTAVLWVTRSGIDLGAFAIPGWQDLLGLKGKVDDGTVAILGTVLMFAVPAFGRPPAAALETPQARVEGPFFSRVLDWGTAREIPWYLLLLFGGGLALADAFATTGLSAWLGDQLVWLKGAPGFVLVLVLCLGMSLLTEVTSNTATTTLVLPVLFAAAGSLEVAPLLLMFPATLCASAAFILPISTPPNAIAAGAGSITPMQMARNGLWINLIAVLLVTLVTLVWAGGRVGF